MLFVLQVGNKAKIFSSNSQFKIWFIAWQLSACLPFRLKVNAAAAPCEWLGEQKGGKMRVWKIVWCSALLSSHWKSLLSSSDNICNFWVRSCRKRCAHGHEHNQNKWKGKGGGLCAYSKIFDIDDSYTNEEDILHHSSLNRKWWVPSYIVYTDTHTYSSHLQLGQMMKGRTVGKWVEREPFPCIRVARHLPPKSQCLDLSLQHSLMRPNPFFQ